MVIQIKFIILPVSDPFEEPVDADLVINTAEQALDKSVKLLEQFILREIS